MRDVFCDLVIIFSIVVILGTTTLGASVEYNRHGFYKAIETEYVICDECGYLSMLDGECYHCGYIEKGYCYGWN